MRSDWSLILPPVRAIYGAFWRQSRWMLLGIAFVVLLSAVGAVATPTLFSRLVDRLEGDTLPVILLWMFVAYALVRGATTSLGYAINYMSVMAATNLNFIAGTFFFERILRKRVSFFIEHNPAEIQQARSKGENAVYVLVQLGLVVFIPGIAQILLTIGVLGTVINLEIVLIVVVYGAGFVSLTYAANKWTKGTLDQAVEADQENAKFVGNAVNAMETLRYFGGDRWIAGTFAEKALEARRAWNLWALRRVTLAVLFGVALAAQLAFTFYLLLPRYYAGELTVGDIVLINLLMIQLNQPFEMIGSTIDDVVRAWSGFLPFARMWAAEEEPETGTRGSFTPRRGEIAFRDVAFGYGDRRILREATFTARRPHITFIIGETGSGKSTLFKLALKALEPDAGTILVDGVDFASISRHDWYEVVGVVPQDILLLNDTLAANIALGRPVDEAKLRNAAARASVLSFIEALPEGFQTRVGERGLKLSGGERQRVAVARALYADPAFLFLDEASSALDEATEAEIMAELRRLGDRMTIVAITHRRSVIAPQDQVIEIVDGVAAPMAGRA